MHPSYSFDPSSALTGYLERIDHLKAEIDRYRPLRGDIWATLQDKLKIDWTYASNAIEGSTLTRGETAFFLHYGLTVEGKPLKDFLDARNHADAIELLYQVIKDERPVSEGLIKELNALLLLDVRQIPAVTPQGEKITKPVTPGRYKTLPNHVLQPDGTIHYYAEPLQVPTEMQYLCEWIQAHLEVLHPLVVGGVAHYNPVRIHPFDDGNGRGARLLMNLILLKKGYSPAIIRTEQRRFYLEALARADRGELLPFLTLVADSLIQTQTMVLDDLRRTA